MAAAGTGLNPLAKTEQCVEISYHFSMGIGKMRQIATKVVNPNKAEGTTVREAADKTAHAVLVTTASASELRSQKRLINSPELDEITSQDGKLKRFIESQSAYAGEAKRFMLRSEVVKVWKAMEAYRTLRRPALVAAFMQKYRELEAVDFLPLAALLGDQFDRKDYRPSDEVEAGFTFWYTIHNVGVISLEGLPSEIVEQEIQKERASRLAAVEDFKGVLRQSAAKMVEALFNQVKPNLDNKRRRLDDSCVTNIIEFIKNYHKQDMADDLGMQKELQKLAGVLRGVTPDKLRESDNLKKFVHDQLIEVKANLGALVVESGRKFR